MSSLVKRRFGCHVGNPITYHESLARVIEAVTFKKGFLEGCLRAPSDHPNVAPLIGLKMHSGSPRFVINREGERAYTGPCAEVLLGRRPAFVDFSGNADVDPWVLLDERLLAAACVREGYVGSVCIITDYGRHLGARHSGLLVEACKIESQGANSIVSVSFDPEQGGKAEHVEPIIAACRRLELVEVRS